MDTTKRTAEELWREFSGYGQNRSIFDVQGG